MKILHTTVRRFGIASAMMLSATFSSAQVKIGNNPTTLNPNAALDVESATKGILFPRVSLTSTTAASPLTSHVAGMQVYNTSTTTDVEPGAYYNDGTKWVRVGGEVEKVFIFGAGAPSGSCTVGTMYVDTLENSATEGDTWTCIAGAWEPYTPPVTPSTTPFYIGASKADAKGNKVSNIWRPGNLGLNVFNPKAKLHMTGTFLMTGTGVSGSPIANGTHQLGGVLGSYLPHLPAATYFAIQNSGAWTNLYLTKRTAANGDPYARFWLNGVVIATITRTAGGVSYNTTSDMRLKENIKPTHYGVGDLMKIEVKDYNYISDKTTPSTGFIAQQLYKVFPGAVTVGGKDAKTNPWSVDYAKVTPLLVKAIQDQQKEIESLKAQLAERDALNTQEVAALRDLLKQAGSRQIAPSR